MALGGFGVAGRLFGGAVPDNAMTGRPSPADPADHLTLLVMVLAEAMFIGWLRFSFGKRFGG